MYVCITFHSYSRSFCQNLWASSSRRFSVHAKQTKYVSIFTKYFPNQQSYNLSCLLLLIEIQQLVLEGIYKFYLIVLVIKINNVRDKEKMYSPLTWFNNFQVILKKPKMRRNLYIQIYSTPILTCCSCLDVVILWNSLVSQ